MTDLSYPLSNTEASENKLALTSAFKKQVGSTITSIILFFLVYLILVVLAVGLAIACFYAGLMLIIALPKLITIAIGIGLMCLGLSVLFFLVKFIFAVSKDENPGRMEITETDQPRLFEFIRQLTKETNTPFPKKIFVSPDVNACVFYNSSFWSMFLPVRKNLEIGLGLVNSVNISEFKAVMAHEFGHFSQRSMKLGSFTYSVNKIIYNMLYENTSYTKFLQVWGNISDYLAIFASITVKIAEAIQYILKRMYKLINTSYLGLSREMEFHADAVAASVSGGNNLVTALSKLDLANASFNTALKSADELLKQNKVSKNIFNNQLTIFTTLAEEHKLPIKKGLPDVSFEFIQSFSKSRVNFKNQWASHPTLEERKDHLEQLNIEMLPNEDSAWQIFDNPVALQEKLTEQVIYQSVKLDTPELCDAGTYAEWYRKEKEKYALPATYKGFYDSRFINIQEWSFDQTPQPVHTSIEEIFNDETAQLHNRITNNQTDLDTITAIKEKQIDAKSFDFDGVKYNRKECDQVIDQLKSEIDSDKAKLNQLDKQAYAFFFNRANGKAEQLKNSYQEFQSLTLFADNYSKIGGDILNTIQPFYAGGISIERVYADIAFLKENLEPKLLESLREIIRKDLITSASNPSLRESITSFLTKNYAYFMCDQFHNEELQQLVDMVLKVSEELHEIKFQLYKKLLEEQLA